MYTNNAIFPTNEITPITVGKIIADLISPNSSSLLLASAFDNFSSNSLLSLAACSSACFKAPLNEAIPSLSSFSASSNSNFKASSDTIAACFAASIKAVKSTIAFASASAFSLSAATKTDCV